MTLAASPILSTEPATYTRDSSPRRESSGNCIRQIRQDVIVPILEAEEPSEVLETKWETFRELRDAIVQTQLEHDDLLSKQDEIEGQLRRAFEGASEALGEKWVKPILGGLHLRENSSRDRPP